MSVKPVIHLTQQHVDALSSITSNASGNFAAAYDYLSAVLFELSPTELASMDVTEDQVHAVIYWLNRASEINRNDESSAANQFIRNVTRFGFAWDGEPAADLQKNSELIGQSVITSAIASFELPLVEEIAGRDVQAAIELGGQTLAGWGGAFYYWSAPYQVGETTVTVGDVLSAWPAEMEKFLSVASAAVYSAAVNEFGDPAAWVNVPQIIATVLEQLVTGAASSAPELVKLQIVGRVAGYVLGTRSSLTDDLTRENWLSTIDMSNALGVSTAGQHGFDMNLATGVIAGITHSKEDFQTFFHIEELIGSNLGDVITLNGSTPLINIQAGSGDDVIHANGGEVIANGGGGFDVFVVDANQTAVNVVRSGSTLTFNGAAGAAFSYVVRDFDQIEFFDATVSFQDLLDQIEQIINGTAGDDTLHGTPGMDVINGLGGHDTIYGYEANDRLYGGSGNDILYGGLGSDAMFGEADNDTFHIGEAEAGDVDYVNGGTHTGTGDVVDVSVGATYRLDAAGAAAIRNQIVANSFAAPTGHGIGIEMAVGDAFVQGVEIIKASDEANELIIGKLAEYASAGGSRYDFTAGTQDVGTFTGEEFAYLVLLGEGGVSKSTRGISTIAFLGIEEWHLTGAVDTVAVDTSHVGTAPVVIYGNGGNDILKLTAFTTNLTIGLGQEISGIGLTVHDFYRIETGSGNDTFYGTDADSFFHGGTGKNLFYGSLGADILYSNGDMVIDYSASAEAVALGYSGTSSSYKVYTGYGVDGSMSKGDVLRVSGTLEILGSIHDDSLSIAGSRGTITSNGGNDTLIGGSGNDTLIGADGYAETMRPGRGNDIVVFGSGGGTLDLSTANSIATIDLAAGTFVFADGSYDIVSGEFERLIATDLNDQIQGTDDADWIIGGNGYDTIDAKGGDDIVTVVRGNVLGGAGNDILSSSGGASTIDGGAGDDTITVGTNSTAYGGEGNDIMTGGDGSYLYGGDGDDVITSNRLNMTVVGGAGADRIMFTNQYSTSSVLSYAESATGVSLQYSTTGYHGIGGDAEGDLVTGRFNIVGSDFADVLLLQGLESTEVHGGGGDDVIGIVAGRGTAYGGSGDDTITLNSRYHQGYGDAGNDIFYGHGAMHGGDGDDEFYLNYGSYALGAGSYTKTDIGGTVYGGSGVNHIVGSGGNDTIHMGAGTNTFVFSVFGGKDGVHSAGADDTIVFAGFEPVDSMEELLGYLVESETKTVFDLGYSNDYPEIYSPVSNPSHLGSITFYGMTAAQVAAINWEFA